MYIKNVLIILTISHISNCETPKFICLSQKPFQVSDSSCGDFNDICVKKDDAQCNNFQAACQQCPPTNFTVFMLQHLKDQMNRANVNQDEIKNQISIANSQINVSLNGILQKPTNHVAIVIACLIFILLNFVSIIFFMKVFIKDKYHRTRNRRIESIEATPLLNAQRIQTESIEATPLLNAQRIQTESIEAIPLLNSNSRGIQTVTSYKLRFQIANQFDETKLFVSKFDNVIKLKKSICDGNMNDYKRMIMKYKGVTLDNNQYLLSCIDFTNVSPIFCEFDDKVDIDAMIVIKLKCDNIYHEMLQIWKYQTIKHLKIIISKLNKTNHEDLLIFYKSNQLDDDDKTIDDYKLEDNDWINIVNKSEEMQNITMKSIFSAKETISIEISIFDKVESIINKSIKKIQHKMVTNHFVVFLNNKLLENEKFIYEYNIDSKSLVEFCYFKKLDEISNRSLIKEYGHIRLFRAKNISFGRPVLLKAYTKRYMEMEHSKDLSKILKEDLQMFQITRSHPRFMQLFGIYMDNDWIYIEMENSTKIQMRVFLSMINELSTYQISKWANQILEGLKHLHNNNIILKDMNPIDTWIDGNHDVKLPSFNMTEYLNYLDENEDNKYQHKDGILSYVAPEILESKRYETSVDVWSLGAILIEVVTHGQLYPDFKESEIVEKIKESHTIEYDKTDKPEELINFIDCCLKGDPKERSTIDQLMKHEFIQKYL